MTKRLIILGIILLLIASGFPTLVRGAAGLYLSREIAQKLGEGTGCRAYLKAPLHHLLQGRADEVNLVLDDLSLKDNPRIARAEVQLKEIAFDLKNKKLKRVGSCRFLVQIRQGDLNRYLALRGKPLKNSKLQLRRDKVFLTGYTGFLFSKVKVELETALVIAGGSRINADIDCLSLEKMKIPSPMIRLIEIWANPVLDLSGEKGDPHIEGLKIEPGMLEAWGTLRITPELLKG